MAINGFWNELLNRVDVKVEQMLDAIGDKSPHFAEKDGAYDDMDTSWWTSGFWPGLIWVMHDMTGKARYKDAAWDWDERLAKWLQGSAPLLHHDVGFQFLSTAVIKYKLTGDKDAFDRGLAAANLLAGRFNPAGNFIRAWNGDHYGWAIVDCMMNISLLFWASEATGDPRYRHIAMRHADTTLRHAIRNDGSVRHILSFDPESGEFLEALGGQGFAPDSAWSRGNAWALYGFANTYRYTKETRYLEAAKRIAHHFIAALPDDQVPYWDFRLPSTEGEPRDSSAAAIAASGLLEIADAVPAGENRMYAGAAERIVRSLTDRYAVWAQPCHDAILTHATGHRPAGMYVDGSLIYGDYYYVEAVAKLNGWKHRIY